MNNNMEKEIFDIYVDDIIPNRFQPRLTFDEKSLNELADSIRQHGIIQPLVVRKIGDKYEIIAGERRYKASQIAGLQKVPAVVMNLDDKQSAEVAVIENIQRRDLTALEEAESYKKLLDKGYLTQEQLATRMGKAQATISNKLRLLGLDEEVKTALLNEKISERHARSLLSLKDPSLQKDTLNKILTNKLTVRQTDDMIKAMLGEPAEKTVETLDFANEPSDLPATPQPFVAVPEVKPYEQSTQIEEDVPINEPVITPMIPSIDPLQTGFTPISNIDINKMKEAAVDINPVEKIANVDALLGINNATTTPFQEQIKIPIAKVEPSRFITSLEDEETNMEMPEPVTPVSFNNFVSTPTPVAQETLTFNDTESVTPPLAQESTSFFEPKTYTDSLVQEFRQTNGPVNEASKIVAGDLRSAINGVREITHSLEKNNFKVDVEEFDFEHLYQIIIKIDK